MSQSQLRPGRVSQGIGSRGDSMARYLVGATLLAGCTLPAFVAAAVPADDVRSLPMAFELRREGPSDICGSKCRSWISAVGSITADTPRQFENFARTHEVHNAVMALDSGGGSVLGTLELGRIVRRFEIMTTVGRTVLLPADKSGDVRATLSPKADCESMCAFLLLSGARRYVPPEAKVL